MKEIKEAIGKREILWGSIIVSSSPINVEISGHIGYDFVLLDSEHAQTGPYGAQMEHLIRAAYAADVTPICRVVHNDTGQIKKCLDFGAKGIVAPFINNKLDAQKLAESCLFPPKGNRGGASVVRATKYGAMGWFDFMDKSNDEVIIMPIIERMAAIENLEDILSVDGINSVLFGPFDLAIELGIRPKGGGALNETVKMLTDPEIYRHMEYVIKTCSSRNIPVANIAWSVDSALEMIQKGCRIIAYTGDNNMFYEIAKQYLDKSREGLKSIKL
ncbi:MAG TPA: aldolase/citrate lyase family protein [Alphaproteobacteria bacterium]|nr:aldolase/citrate lyase family protein [Alphaproteobacteria bacterium]